MRGVVWGTRQNAYLDEFFSVVWLKIAPQTAKCCPTKPHKIFSFSAVFGKKIRIIESEKKFFQHHDAPKPLRNHLQRTPLTKPSATKLVWTHMDV